MKNENTESRLFDKMSGEWMEATSKYWDTTFKLQQELTNNIPTFWNMYQDTFAKSGSSQKVGNSITKFLISFFSKSENLSALSRFSELMPVLVMNLSSHLLESFNELQSNLVKKSSKLGGKLKELNIEDFNAGLFSIWKELYKTDFQKFFNIPQLGLARNYQEQINVTLDRGNRSFIALSEFLNLLYLPVEKAGAVVMEQYREMVDSDTIPEDPKALYKSWIKNLEKYYMEMLGSSQYTKALHSLIETMAEFKESKSKLTESILRQLNVPTNAEMDELYKDIYMMKKRIKSLERQLAAEKKPATEKKAAKSKKAAKGKK
jgi:class III poly(R)-hydroxyalkanoic acid synthase PhaE subunit